MTDTLTDLPLVLFTPWAPNVAAAFIAAQADMPDITKDKKAKLELKGGGSYSYSYADLGLVVGAVRPILAAHGLAQVQDVVTVGNNVAVSTTLVHKSGESITFGPLTFNAGGTPQQTGSAITYARRYALLAALGLATEDDDGAKASAPTPAVVAPPMKEPSSGSIALYTRVKATKGTPLADTLKEFAAESDRKLSSFAFDADPVYAAQIDDILASAEPPE